MNINLLFFIVAFIIFSTFAAPLNELKKCPELAHCEINFTKPPNTAVSPSAKMRKRGVELAGHKPGESEFIGDANYPVTEPPKDSVTPLGVEEENTWFPDFLGLGDKK